MPSAPVVFSQITGFGPVSGFRRLRFVRFVIPVGASGSEPVLLGDGALVGLYWSFGYSATKYTPKVLLTAETSYAPVLDPATGLVLTYNTLVDTYQPLDSLWTLGVAAMYLQGDAVQAGSSAEIVGAVWE